ncbi:MAG TPA: pyridoxamine 5'-phosphate oxidase family protein [Vicinamibacteria bacterium]|nr:pyridoxamine 5'-phosphate oxidase family protein [Vicinamibacteria bacterium]
MTSQPDRIERPRFRALSRPECEALLVRNSAGRVAFVHGHRPDIIPIHYVFAGTSLCWRTAPGTRLDEASRNFNDAWPVAFEVDEIEGLFRWRSVVVHGNLHAAAEGDAEWQRDVSGWEEAMRSFRNLVPGAFTPRDPTGFRDVLLRIDVAELSGREALPGRLWG